jgi:hypothetical protein
MARRASYEGMRDELRMGLMDLRVLCGDEVGPSGATWQQIAGLCASHFEALASMLRGASRGNHEAYICFPSPDECLDEATDARVKR